MKLLICLKLLWQPFIIQLQKKSLRNNGGDNPKPARFFEATKLSLPGGEETKEEDWTGWRKISGVGLLRELRTDVFVKMSRLAKWLYDSNPLAKRIIEYIKNFVVGEGIYFETTDKRVQEVLNAFWFDDVNNWPLKQHDRILELCLYGECIWPVTVNPANGHVRCLMKKIV